MPWDSKHTALLEAFDATLDAFDNILAVFRSAPSSTENWPGEAA
jgi:hypothetical protein